MINLSTQEITLRLRYGFAFFIFFYLFYGTASVIGDYVPWHYHVAFDWEKDIPFIPQAAWIYNSLGLLLILCLFIIKDEQQIQQLFKIFCIQVMIASILFVLFPIVKTFPLHDTQSNLPLIFVFADRVNLNNNDLPSLHVCLAYTGVIFVVKGQLFIIKMIFYCWATSIAISTLLIHAHHLLDIIGGMVLALSVIFFYYHSPINFFVGD